MRYFTVPWLSWRYHTIERIALIKRINIGSYTIKYVQFKPQEKCCETKEAIYCWCIVP
jgi:hypothetical protein